MAKIAEKVEEYQEEVYRSDFILIYKHKSSGSLYSDFDRVGYCKFLLPYFSGLVKGVKLLKDDNGFSEDSFIFPNGLIINPRFNYQQIAGRKIMYSGYYPPTRKVNGWHYSSNKWNFPEAGVSILKHPFQVAKDIINRVYKPAKALVEEVDKKLKEQEDNQKAVADFASRVAAAFVGRCESTPSEAGMKYRLIITAGKFRIGADVVSSSIYLDNYGTVTLEQLIQLVALMDSW